MQREPLEWVDTEGLATSDEVLERGNYGVNGKACRYTYDRQQPGRSRYILQPGPD